MVMKIERPIYMQQLIDSKDNGLIKIVTGLRRLGKSYLLKTLFKEYLLVSFRLGRLTLCVRSQLKEGLV